ncbi:MAG: hypothetical protein Q5556_02510, partial [Haemophilus parainfluenzae]|nr:hypothetical protein [Haemophilus parainfluenzae]
MGLIPLKQVKKHDENQPHFLPLLEYPPLPLPQHSIYPFVSIFILKFDQPQIFEKKPYKNYCFLVSYACVELFL